MSRMDLTVPASAVGELAPAYLQAIVTLGIAALCGFLWGRYRKPYFLVWAVAWSVFALRLGAIILFIHTGNPFWLYAHQVTTGWTALALLWAALLFSIQLSFRRVYLWALFFPPLWSYVAIYRMDNFLLAALPAVLFLSGATLWTAWAFYRYQREARSGAARLLAITLLLWSIHHLDYPFLRARGIWNPWGYYLDLLFVLGTGVGILLLVQEDLDQGLKALSGISGDLHRGASNPDEDVLGAVLQRSLTLRAVRGSAMALEVDGHLGIVQGAGACADWPDRPLQGPVEEAIARVMRMGEPVVVRGNLDSDTVKGFPYTAALPVLIDDRAVGALLVVGEARDPFTALDTAFLVALGQQVGTGLQNQKLYARLASRTAELERLQVRMVRQHEEERQRLSRELHDETAQVFAAVKLQLGILQEHTPPEQAPRLARALELVSQGIQSIRNVTRGLRPAALTDLGLIPALQALRRDFSDREGLQVSFEGPSAAPQLSGDTELALYRSLQEGLSNVARHANARTVCVCLTVEEPEILLTVVDDGDGLPSTVDPLGGGARTGLAGLRERISALGGRITFPNVDRGVRIEVRLPINGVSG